MTSDEDFAKLSPLGFPRDVFRLLPQIVRQIFEHLGGQVLRCGDRRQQLGEPPRSDNLLLSDCL